MKNKIVNLFDQSKNTPNKGVKYSTLLEQFVAPFKSEFKDFEYYEDIFELAIHAWNFGNFKLILPKEKRDEIFHKVDIEDIDVDLLKRMIDYKVKHFKEHTKFIADFEIKETGDIPVLTVIAQEQDVFISEMFEKMDAEKQQSNFENNFINRTAIVLKPSQPFLDWYLRLYPDDPEEFLVVKSTRIYLISEDIDDAEAWLKKKFKKIFELELDTWHFNKKEWPQKRNYKMFQGWFQVDISKSVYDLENEPVYKTE
jgi:hypothetical protein